MHTYCFLLIRLFLYSPLMSALRGRLLTDGKFLLSGVLLLLIDFFSVVSWRWRMVVRHGCPDSSNPLRVFRHQMPRVEHMNFNLTSIVDFGACYGIGGQ
ncbi:hypothetical protein V8C44DRAFT_330308 [Trichoderma aethiopicum]